MAAELVFPDTGYLLKLADGTRYVIRAGDPAAQRVVQVFAVASQLTPRGELTAEHVVVAVTAPETGMDRSVR
ncbi:MAG: hypothetical protein RMK79_05455, partial [Anaerolineae bacterium]|nr:hypothetical protein [Anaerolineae bacterium]